MPAIHGITSYEVDTQRLAIWTMRIFVGVRPGQRPLEFLIPGELKIRCARRIVHAVIQ